MLKAISRRGLLRLGATSLALTFVPRSVLGGAGQTAASDTIRIGGIGVGRQGRTLLHVAWGARVVAVADLYERHLAEVTRGRDWQAYKDYRALLDRRDIDAVTVGTPDHWHIPVSLHAVEAGKDAYCEKPLSLTIREGRLLADAVRRYRRVFQTGSQQRSSDICRTGCELVRNGRAGRIHTVHGYCYPSPWEPELPEQPVPPGLDWDAWLGQAAVHPYNVNIHLPRARPGWISFRAFSGGEMTGWGAHGLDIIQWGLGMDASGPTEVWADGGDIKSAVHYRYASGTVVHLGRGPMGGGIFVGDQGEILVDRGRLVCTPREIGRDTLRPGDVRLYVSRNHLQNWVECIRSRAMPICDVEIGHRSATMCHLGNIARWLAPRRLRWDPEKEEFPGDGEANRLVARPQREPYVL